MRLYFYAARPSVPAKDYYENIIAFVGIPDCIELAAGGQLKTSAFQRVSDSDVILLYVEAGDDIEHLQQFSDYLEDFQIILILGNPSQPLLDECYGVQSRLVCQGKEDLAVLNQVLIKMFTVSTQQACREGPAQVC